MEHLLTLLAMIDSWEHRQALLSDYTDLELIVERNLDQLTAGDQATAYVDE